MKVLCTSIAAVMAAATVAAASARSAGSLQFRAAFAGAFDFSQRYCLPDTPPSVECVRFVTRATVPGLGRATATYVKTLGDPRYGCSEVTGFGTATIEVAGKGEINVALPPVCTAPAPALTPATAGLITGGSGAYAGASGSVEFSSSVTFQTGARDFWAVTLTVPGLEFDVAPPVMAGHRSLIVRAPRGAKRVAVGYSVTAVDGRDGSLPVSCLPRPGSRFGIGRTRVTCSAEDSSANVATVRFTVTVRPRAPQ